MSLNLTCDNRNIILHVLCLFIPPDEEVMLSICGKNTDERNLTNAQRLALYQYCVDSSKAARRATFTDDDLLFLSDRKGE